jgi:hypothetical protein
LRIENGPTVEQIGGDLDAATEYCVDQCLLQKLVGWTFC